MDSGGGGRGTVCRATGAPDRVCQAHERGNVESTDGGHPLSDLCVRRCQIGQQRAVDGHTNRLPRRDERSDPLQLVA